MKFVLGAAIAAMALAGAAMAQTTTTPTVPASRCPAFPAEPQLPDGATTRSATVMNRGAEAYEQWGREMLPVLQCRQQEARDLRAAYEAAHTNAEARITEFNAAVERQRAVCRAWMEEVGEFNDRNGGRQNNNSGDPCAGEGQ
ncbi:MAG: hypothetical protein AB7O04_12410 [Hyphomonadaceae bacterium]